MSSELFYSVFWNDEEKAKTVKERIGWTVSDIRRHLLDAKEKMTERFDFEFSVEHVKLRLNLTPAQLDMELDESGFDQSILGEFKYDKEKKEIQIKIRPPENDLVYTNSKGDIEKLKFRTKTRLSDIRFQGEDESKTNRFLNLIFSDSARIIDGKKERRILNSNERENYVDIQGYPRNNILVLASETVQIDRQIKALDALVSAPRREHRSLLNLLIHKNDCVWERVESENIECNVLEKEYSGFEEQKKFVEKALGSPDFSILIGPPGSGKTATIIELITQAASRGKKILLVASTHVAIDNILERIKEERKKKGTIADEFGIIPVRIGVEDVISDKVSDYMLDRKVRSELDRILSSLSKIVKRTPSQDALYNALNDDGSEVMERMILDTSNLICGTTMGIVNAPMIRDGSGTYLFDLMIIDEASKTTFPEFLVPALYAKKWVISGDPNQLAPYVDDDTLRKSLEAATENLNIADEQKAICVNVFNSVTNYQSPNCEVVIVPDDYRFFDDALEQKRCLEKDNERSAMLVINRHPLDENTLRLVAASNVILVRKGLFEGIKQYLSPFSIIMEGSDKRAASDALERQKEYLEKKLRQKPHDGEDSWEHNIVWRMSRMYEMYKSDDEERTDNKYQREIELLMPRFGDEKSQKIGKVVDNIRRVALPSIMDLLEKGFESGRDKTPKVTLFMGLPKKIIEDRSVRLSYQHRMHPEISKFPRKYIYNDNALKDGDGIETKRKLNFKRYSNSRSILKNVKLTKYTERNENPDEVNVMLTEVEQIMDWTKDNPKKNGSWSVALLTFYRGQEKLIKDALNKKFKTKREKRYFDLKETHNLEIQIGTVDRFQGHEADFVILSFVRSKEHRKGVGFLDTRNRLNVAITRARYALVVLADKEFFCRKKSLLKDFMESLGSEIRWR